ANLKRAEVMAQEFPGVPLKTQILVGKPFQVIMQWAEEIKPSLLVLARHGAHRIEGTELGSQAENLVRLATCNVLLAGTGGVKPEDIPWIEEDGVAGLPWAPEAEVRILRVPPFAQGIARRAVEQYVLEQMKGEPATVTNRWLDEAIRKLLPTHMQLIMGIGTAEEIALAEVKAQEQMKGTKVQGHDADPQPLTSEVEVKCPVTGAVSRRPRTAADPIVWTEEAWQRLQLVPLIARPLARNTVERFARGHDIWRVTTRVMAESKPETDVDYVPHVVAWNLTRRCNLECAHCYIAAGPHESAATELDKATCLGIVDQVLSVNPAPMLILSGGEPLLRDDLNEIAHYASAHGATVVVGTNGTLLTDERIAALQAAGVRGVAVSIDSLRPSYHDNFR